MWKPLGTELFILETSKLGSRLFFQETDAFSYWLTFRLTILSQGLSLLLLQIMTSINQLILLPAQFCTDIKQELIVFTVCYVSLAGALLSSNQKMGRN